MWHIKIILTDDEVNIQRYGPGGSDSGVGQTISLPPGSYLWIFTSSSVNISVICYGRISHREKHNHLATGRKYGRH